MANIILGYRMEYGAKKEPIETYARCVHRELEALGHEVLPVGEGHANRDLGNLPVWGDHYELFLDLDTGRNSAGELHFLVAPHTSKEVRSRIKTAVWFIDSHGYPSLHKRLAEHYDHVFFAVWRRRELFASHPSTHWCPNASDLKWFFPDGRLHKSNFDYQIGFFGSKGGLHRADELKEICDRHQYVYNIGQICPSNKQRWPHTAYAMHNCRLLFNRGQKHDGPNQRVIESMLTGRALITDRDPMDGMNKLFEEGEHYLGWETPSELANQLEWCLRNNDQAFDMAKRAFDLASEKHQIINRVEQILEVCNV